MFQIWSSPKAYSLIFGFCPRLLVSIDVVAAGMDGFVAFPTRVSSKGGLGSMPHIWIPWKIENRDQFLQLS